MRLYPKSAGGKWQNTIANPEFRWEGESHCWCCYCDDEVDEDDIEESLKELSQPSLSESAQDTEGKEARWTSALLDSLEEALR
jgi:hypothetical protein